ncbi:MAG: 50S ribosomal protein L29 [Thermodesulfobacteriota bacterium]
MKIDELRAITVEDLKVKRLELSKDLSLLKLQNATGQLENPIKVRMVRKDIAKVETVLSEINAKKEDAENGS